MQCVCELWAALSMQNKSGGADKIKIEAVMSENYKEAYINFNKPRFSDDQLFPGQPGVWNRVTTKGVHQASTDALGGGPTLGAHQAVRQETKLQYLAGYCSYTEDELQEQNKKLPKSAQEYKLSRSVRSAPHTLLRNAPPRRTHSFVTPSCLHYCAKRRLGRPSWPRAGERS